MSVTTTSMGSNSAYVVYTASETKINILNEISTWATSHGWSVYDDRINASSYVVLSAPCLSGTANKFLQLDMASSNLLVLRVYESWNNSTHVGTNECYVNGIANSSSNTTAGQYYDLTNGGYFYLFANARYFVVYGKRIGVTTYGNVAQSPTGIFEIANDYGETGGYPLFCLLCLNLLLDGGTHPGIGFNSPSYTFNHFSVPRNTDGTTAAAAEGKCVILTPFGGMFKSAPDTSRSPLYYISTNCFVPTTNNPWTSKPFSGNLIAGKVRYSSSLSQVNGLGYPLDILRGRIYGIKMLNSNAGQILDTCSIKVDAQGFQDYNGSDATHHILRAQGTVTSINNSANSSLQGPLYFCFAIPA